MGVALLVGLPGRARATLGRYGGTIATDTILRELNVAEHALGVTASLDQGIKAMKERFNAGTMMALELAHSVIGPTTADPRLTPEHRDTVYAAATDLIDALREDSVIPPEVKRILFEHAEAVLRALNLISAGGAQLVIDERDRMVGRFAVDAELQRKVAAAPRTVREKVMGLLNALLLVGNLLHLGVALPGEVRDALEPPSTSTIAPGNPGAPPEGAA